MDVVSLIVKGMGFLLVVVEVSDASVPDHVNVLSFVLGRDEAALGLATTPLLIFHWHRSVH